MKTIDEILAEIERRADSHAERISAIRNKIAPAARQASMDGCDQHREAITELLALKAFIQAEPPAAQPYPNGRFADKEKGGV